MPSLIGRSCGVLIGAVLALISILAPSFAAAENGMYANLPGVKLWFTDSGGSGTPIVLLHSNTGNSDIWAPQITAFAKAGYRVIAFDRRGWAAARRTRPGRNRAASPAILTALSII